MSRHDQRANRMARAWMRGVAAIVMSLGSRCVKPHFCRRVERCLRQFLRHLRVAEVVVNVSASVGLVMDVDHLTAADMLVYLRPDFSGQLEKWRRFVAHIELGCGKVGLLDLEGVMQ